MARLACLVFLVTSALAAGGRPQDQARVLQAELARIQETQPNEALAKGEEALALLAGSPDPALEMALLQDVGRLQIRAGSLSKAALSLDRGESLAKARGDKATLRVFLGLRASLKSLEGSTPEAVRIAQEVLAEAQAAGDLPAAMDALSMLGQCAGATGDFPQGIQFLYRALELADRTHDTRRRASQLSTISNFYIHTLDWDKALKANQEATAAARTLQEPYRLAILRVNASQIFGNLNRPDDEYAALMEAKALGTRAGNPRILMAVEFNLSDVQLKRKDYRSAAELSAHSLEMARKLGATIHVGMSQANRGIALNRLGQHEAGLASLEEGLKVIQGLKAAPEEVDILGCLSEEYAFAGNYRKALDCHLLFKEKSDKLYHDARNKKLQELESRYQSEKQGREIAQLRAESQRRALIRNFSIAGALMGLALAAALLARYRLLRRSSAQQGALNRQLETIDAMVRSINHHTDLKELAQDLLEKGRALIPQADRLGLFLVDAGRRAFRPEALLSSRPGEEATLAGVELAYDDAVERYSRRGQELEPGVFLVRDFQDLPGSASMDRVEKPAAMLALALEPDGVLEGFLVLDHMTDPDGFHRSDAAALERFREHAVSAIAKARTLAKLEDANAALREASMVDPMTGLKNRRFLDLSMPEELARLDRQWKAPVDRSRDALNVDLLFYMVDLDHFKAVNDEFGHAAGDAVLRQASLALRSACRESDFVVRWGGEEFLVVARSSDRQCAHTLAQGLLAAIAGQAFDVGGGVTLRRTCSIGFSAFPVLPKVADAFSWEESVALADRCLYAAKRSGRNAWVGLQFSGEAETRDLATIPALIGRGEAVVLTSLPAGTPLAWEG